ncbi:MAG: hypothetical protein UW16_C0002G0019 [Microgenomates group bacterium GW2011_GWC1_44_10]|nr:MAG: hypothetical protein UW16_C0002G0019 [Microgenomates group bacterium GW2011_GWC1_44_10]
MADQNSILCPNCKQHTAIVVRSVYKWPKDQHTTYEIAECNSCDFFVLVNRFGSRIQRIYPSPLPKTINEKAPEFLTKDLEEAYLCYSVGAYRATGVLTRRALQLCCIEKGAPDNKLEDQIDWLLEKQIITKELKDWAHEVRLTGNDAAHPPKKVAEDERVTGDDAEDILTLLEKFIDVLYIAPALAEERRQKRNPK